MLPGRKPDLTLPELRQAMQLACTLPALHSVLARLARTYKKALRAREQDRPDNVLVLDNRSPH